MRAQTIQTLKEIVSTLRAGRPLGEPDRRRLAERLDQCLWDETRDVREVYREDRNAGVVSSGRINRPPEHSFLARSLPPGDRD